MMCHFDVGRVYVCQLVNGEATAVPYDTRSHKSGLSAGEELCYIMVIPRTSCCFRGGGKGTDLPVHALTHYVEQNWHLCTIRCGLRPRHTAHTNCLAILNMQREINETLIISDSVALLCGR